MKKSIVTGALMLLMMLSSCGTSTSTSSGSSVDPEPVKPSTTYTDADEADAGEQSGGKDEPIIVESSPYTQEELYFGDRVFGKDFLEANSVRPSSVYDNENRIVTFDFSYGSSSYIDNATIVDNLPDFDVFPFSLLTEGAVGIRSATNGQAYACKEVGGLYANVDPDSNDCYMTDGFGSYLEILEDVSTFTFNLACFGTAALAHAEGEPHVVRNYVEVGFTVKYTGGTTEKFTRVYFYDGYEYTGESEDYTSGMFCSVDTYHQGDSVTDNYMTKISLDAYGKKDWYYYEDSGHYRFYNEEGKIVSSFAAANYSSCVAAYTHAWFAGNHLNVQVTYKTKDDHNYTFTDGTDFYQTSYYIFEYTTGKTYQIKNINYVVTDTADMKYSNTYYDFTLANIKFVSNKQLLNYDYSFVIDKDYVLRDDVTDLISAKIYKTDNYYYSETDENLVIFTKDGKHTLSVPKADIAEMYPISEMFEYKTSSSKLTMIGFDGVVKFDTDMNFFTSSAVSDGFRYILGRKTSDSELYMFDTVSRTRTFLCKYSDWNSSAVGRYVFYKDTTNGNYVIFDMQTGEPYLTLSATTYPTVSKFVTYSGNGFTATFVRFAHSGTGNQSFKIVKFGDKYL